MIVLLGFLAFLVGQIVWSQRNQISNWWKRVTWNYNNPVLRVKKQYERRRVPDFIGFFLGGAVGDAVGVGVEMIAAKDMPALLTSGLFQRYISVRKGSYATNYVEGCYSDDTQDVLAFAKVLTYTSAAEIDEKILIDAIIKEYDRSINCLGHGRQGQGSILRYLNDRRPTVLQQIRDKHSDPRVIPGNAPVMRAAIFAFVHDDAERERLAILNANITHPHDDARSASAALVYAVRQLVFEACPSQDIISSTIGYLSDRGNESLLKYLHEVDQLAAPIITDGTTLIIDRVTLVGSEYGLRSDSRRTLGAVLYFLKHLDEDYPWNTLIQCILLGGDVDTLGSVVMSVAGARGLIDWEYYTNWPKWTIEKLEGARYIYGVAEEFEAFHQGFPRSSPSY